MPVGQAKSLALTQSFFVAADNDTASFHASHGVGARDGTGRGSWNSKSPSHLVACVSSSSFSSKNKGPVSKDKRIFEVAFRNDREKHKSARHQFQSVRQLSLLLQCLLLRRLALVRRNQYSLRLVGGLILPLVLPPRSDCHCLSDARCVSPALTFPKATTTTSRFG